MSNILFNMGMLIFGYLIPVFIIIYCYIQIIRAVVAQVPFHPKNLIPIDIF